MSSLSASPASHPFAKTLDTFKTASGKSGRFYSLPKLARQFPNVKRLPVSLRIVLEAVLRQCDGQRVTREHVQQLAQWQPNAPRNEEIPFVVARVVLQDFTGVPLLADLAAMRNVAAELGKPPSAIEPLVPVDLVVDHSVMIDYFGSKKALDLNMKLEFERNRERYEFMKWGMQAFDTFGVVPPGFGIVHQVNLEYLARGVHKTGPKGDKLYYPDTLVGTDSHTTMINGIGVVGWGVGGIEAEAGMLGQPVYFLTPDVVGVHLTGRLREGVTATDLVLTITELLRKQKVVGKFVEFFGEGTASLTVPDRATLANMAPEYGATMGFFPVDERTLDYFQGTGRKKGEIEALEAYFRAQGLFGVPGEGEIDYSEVVTLDLETVAPSLAGPKRPQDRIEITHLSSRFNELFTAPASANGFNQPAEKLDQTFNTSDGTALHNGDVLIAAITSCTNTSNPSVMLAAGLLAKKAVEAGLTVAPHIKTSLAPGSRIVTDYLTRTGLLPYLEKLGFNVAAYGCTTCIGNAGDLTAPINEAITSNDLVACAVLSGNRNFEARIHPLIKANFLASPPLVVAYAIAGNVRKDLMTQPLGQGKKGKDVYLGDIWPSSEEVDKLLRQAMRPKTFRENYEQVGAKPGKLWEQIQGSTGEVYPWPTSGYIARPPFFDGFEQTPTPREATVQGARIMALFGDSITTDHISPAGSIKPDSPAGRYLQALGVKPVDFNSYGSRRGNHEVMMRGTFANVRIKNLMLPPTEDGSRVEGGYTLMQLPGETQGQRMAIYDAAMAYQAAGVPTVIFAGEEYGTGSSRDWAAKGTRLQGIRAVVARSFERIHRSNLVGMGVLPLQFQGSDSWSSLGLTGSEVIDIRIEGELLPQRNATLVIHRADGSTQEVTLTLRIDTPIEVEYYRHGGILPYVLRQLLA
ncbi:aconitate hydratase AcnA [Ideonella dechloratans]|uniref:Aconitate hydratase n=1 Tax=Ideonella dechloratans TaxID=36863 RepID=A0A643FEW3_IDEDE|nr:aconitate hydratase AcnA [Ideonella dechloratans]KAB0584213.1 aconitate hydratase AcnA [Ideonella dechloratans]UFU08561.1 aconitate hydratase AcnA [Ideonella dechloratans]